MKFGLREILFLAVMIGTVAASFLATIAIARREATEAETNSWKIQLASLNQPNSDNVDWNKKIAELKEAIKYLEGKLPAEKEIDVILTQVENMVKANAWKRRWFKPLKDRPQRNYNELPIEMTLSGDFNGFYAFSPAAREDAAHYPPDQHGLTRSPIADGRCRPDHSEHLLRPDGGSKVATRTKQPTRAPIFRAAIMENGK